MKSPMLVFVAAALTASLTATAAPKRPAPPRVARVGFVFSETGAAAVYGASQRRGAALAVETLNAAAGPGDPRIQALFADDASAATVGEKTFRKLIRSEKVVCLVGPTLSGTAFAADPIAQHDGVPVLGVSNTAEGITAIGDFVFRDSLTEAVVIPSTIHAVKTRLGITSAALLYQTADAYTLGAAQAFRDGLAAEGIPLLQEETFAKGDTDFTAQLTAIRDLGPGALLVASFAAEGAAIVKQARALGIPAGVTIIGGNGLNSPAFLIGAGVDGEGVIVGAAWNPELPAPESQAFVSAFTLRYGIAPDQFAAQAYAGVQIVHHALVAAGAVDDPDAIRAALAGIDGLPTVLGPFTFTPARDADHPPVVQVVHGGAFTLF